MITHSADAPRESSIPQICVSMSYLADKLFRMFDLLTAEGPQGLKRSKSPGLTALNVLDFALPVEGISSSVQARLAPQADEKGGVLDT